MQNRAKNQIMLVFIRHGKTQANSENRYLGRTDESISNSGAKELLSYKTQNYYPSVDYVFTSPMKRCIETAKIIYHKLSLTVIPEWREIDFGRFEYKNYSELKKDVQYQAWIDSQGTLDFPEGESRKHFIMRCERGFIKMCDILCHIAEQNTNTPIWLGIIVHGGTIMALLSSFGGKNYFDCQPLNGRGYICSMRWYETISDKNNIKIEVVKKI